MMPAAMLSRLFMPPERFFFEVFGAVSERGPVKAPRHRFRQFAASEAVIPPKGRQILLAGEPGIESQFLRNPSERRASLRGAGREAEDRDAACVG
jgi:hypothetical protein